MKIYKGIITENYVATQLKANGLDLFVFAITDIINSNSQAIVLGKNTEIFEKGFVVFVPRTKACLL